MAKREIKLDREDFITCRVTGEKLYRVVGKSEDGLEVIGGYAGENVVIGSDAWVTSGSSISGSVYLLGETLITSSTIYQTSLGNIEITNSNIINSDVSSSQAGRKIVISNSVLSGVTDIGGMGMQVSGTSELVIVDSVLEGLSKVILAGILSNVKMNYHSRIESSDEFGIVRLWCKDLVLDDYAVLSVESNLNDVMINNVKLCEESRLYVHRRPDSRDILGIASVNNLKLAKYEKLWTE